LLESKNRSERARGTLLLTAAHKHAVELGLDPIRAEIESVLGGATSMQESLKS
jgi:hypothetical protein